MHQGPKSQASKRIRLAGRRFGGDRLLQHLIGELTRSGQGDVRRFEEVQPMRIGVPFIFLPLAGYYLAPYFLISRHITLPPWTVALVLCLYIVGIFFHYVGDAQKFYILRFKKGLIEDGLFAYTRNPNYLGEILIYLSFAILSWHWMPFCVLAAWVFGFFVRNMLNKDKGLSRYPTFSEYKLRTGLLFPKLTAIIK
jgi:steroid 5-alpha reductase family enzyme